MAWHSWTTMPLLLFWSEMPYFYTAAYNTANATVNQQATNPVIMVTDIYPYNVTQIGNVTEIDEEDGPSALDIEKVMYTRVFIEFVFVPFGLVSNIISLSVFTRSKLGQTSTGHFLIALAIADSTLLFAEVLGWIEKRNQNGYIMPLVCIPAMDFYCKLVYFLRYSGRMASSWLTVAITIERFITVAFPLHVSRISTPFRSKLTIVSICVICVGTCSFPLYTMGMRKNCDGYCTITNLYVFNVFKWLCYDLGLLILPCIIISIFACLILFKLFKASQQRKHHLEGQAQAARKSHAQEQKITMVMLSISIAYVVLRLPYTIINYVRDYPPWELSPWTDYHLYFISSVLWTMSTLNFCINFFFYFFIGSAFRNELKTCCGCVPHQDQPAVSVYTASSTTSTHSLSTI